MKRSPLVWEQVESNGDPMHFADTEYGRVRICVPAAAGRWRLNLDKTTVDVWLQLLVNGVWASVANEVFVSNGYLVATGAAATFSTGAATLNEHRDAAIERLKRQAEMTYRPPYGGLAPEQVESAIVLGVRHPQTAHLAALAVICAEMTEADVQIRTAGLAMTVSVGSAAEQIGRELSAMLLDDRR